MKIKYFGLTDKGLVRQTNEDSILINDLIVNNNDRFIMDSVKHTEITGKPMWFSVSDGMGGHDSGEVASRIALEQLLKGFNADGINYLKNHDELKSYIEGIHREVNRMAVADGKDGMGCTLVGTIFNESNSLLYNVGDSRVYIFRNRYLQQKTRDHSLKEQTDLDVPKNIIISSIGGGKDDIMIDIYDISDQMKSNDLMLICSDGLTDIDLDTHYDEFESLIADNIINLRELCEKLLEYALDKGSADNISIIAVLFHD